MTNNNYASKINNIMDKAKEDVRTQIDRAYQQGYADAKSELGQNAIDLAHEESDRAYQQGLEDAWEAARKLALSSSEGGLDIETVAEIFDGLTYYTVLKDVSALEAISKIKEYEEKQEQFAVGDEVYSDAFDDKGIITHITADKVACVCIICNGSTMMKVGTNGLHKTGRHFDAISEILAEMRGE